MGSSYRESPGSVHWPERRPLTCPLPVHCVQKETVGDLTILNAQLRHGGKYTCMAQTVVDSASKEATVLVRGDRVPTATPTPTPSEASGATPIFAPQFPASPCTVGKCF